MSDRNNNLAANVAASPIQDFYRDGCILITGGTGFVGKALIEKLLRSCPEISTIFVLIRSKRGQDPESRFRDLVKNTVFDRIRNENSGLLKKIVLVAGDLTENNFGLSDSDHQRLLADVTVVFHSAATVRFNEDLKVAVNLNTKATQRVIEFCANIHNLKALVHISTAYSNAEKKTVEEVVYKPPANPFGVMELCQNFDDKTLQDMSECLMDHGNHPNTYTLTKAMAEWVVHEQADSYPAAIVRPSIVTAAWREPMPGWVDNISGITGIMMEIGRGTIRSIICDEQLIVDIVPVDIVVNTLIAAAWHIFTFRSNSVRVYNCTSGSLNAIHWHELGRLTKKHALTVPTKYIQWYPGFSFRTNRFVHWTIHILFHFMPAFFIDSVLRMQGSKPIMMRICDKFKKTAKTGEFFALHEWDFKCDNQKSLSFDMTEKDKKLFTSDVTLLRWDEYVKQYMIGIRKYVLKDSMDSLPAAKQKLQRLYLLHRCSQVVAAFMLLKLIGLR
ncbi:putative fatty acyl-CoA reductase CG5065 [Homalodisca vitripennis]|uniref:putative fatty acyl-CoA reductase CG5065 n=1 Tax=Homalodisca vitripennis TaxID=197043 RepID=UPI001EEC8D31|nr:putative fatty acyl-CoA reductase CG5065 [Homalodisca vitripennis]XP_046683187.1 putative fatty acyl-CoA reductase CG5065 [Homalodisca vitripennis]